MARARAALDAAGPFGRLRALVLAALAVDLVVALALAVNPGSGPRLEAWFQPGFPSNLVVVDNAGDPLDDVTLELDGRWAARLVRLEPGVRGLEITRDFRSTDGAAPPAEHRPRTLRIRGEGEDTEVELEARGGP